MDQNQNHLAQARSWEQLCQCPPNPQCRRPRRKGMAWLWLWIGFHECNQKSVLMSFGVGRCNSRIQYLSKLCNAAIQIYSLYLLFSSSSSKTMCQNPFFSNWKKRSLKMSFSPAIFQCQGTLKRTSRPCRVLFSFKVSAKASAPCRWMLLFPTWISTKTRLPPKLLKKKNFLDC